MDDFVDSFDSIEEAFEISKQLKENQKNGGFDHRGFTSNSNEVIMSIDGALSSKVISVSDNTENIGITSVTRRKRIIKSIRM